MSELDVVVLYIIEHLKNHDEFKQFFMDEEKEKKLFDDIVNIIREGA